MAGYGKGMKGGMKGATCAPMSKKGMGNGKAPKGKGMSR